MTPQPKPARAPKARNRLKRSALPRRSSTSIRRRATLGAKRRAVKAAGGVDSDTWAAICDFYRDASGLVRCAYGCGRPATQQDHVMAIARGGKHEASNVVPIDARCNFVKGTRTWSPARRHPFMEAA